MQNILFCAVSILSQEAK